MILARLGVKHPILLAPMAGVSTPKLAAAVSNAGGLGALGLGANNAIIAKAQILETQALTNYPFQVNFFCHKPQPLDITIQNTWIDYLTPEFAKFGHSPPTQLKPLYSSFLENDDLLNVVLDTRPKAVSFHFGIPHKHQIQLLKEAGILTLVTATNLPEAMAIEAAGIDIIIAQGIEAGGHRGIFNPHFDAAIRTSDLVQLLVKHCQIPIVAAGGIMNGKQAKLMLKLGAQAVQLGTAFIQCSQSNAGSAYRQALFEQSLTQITNSISGRPARGLINAWHNQIDQPERPTAPAYPYCYDIGKQLNAVALEKHNDSFAAYWAGANVNQIRKLEAHDLVNQLVLEMYGL